MRVIQALGEDLEDDETLFNHGFDDDDGVLQEDDLLATRAGDQEWAGFWGEHREV